MNLVPSKNLPYREIDLVANDPLMRFSNKDKEVKKKSENRPCSKI